MENRYSWLEVSMLQGAIKWEFWDLRTWKPIMLILGLLMAITCALLTWILNFLCKVQNRHLNWSVAFFPCQVATEKNQNLKPAGIEGLF